MLTQLCACDKHKRVLGGATGADAACCHERHGFSARLFMVLGWVCRVQVHGRTLLQPLHPLVCSPPLPGRPRTASLGCRSASCRCSAGCCLAMSSSSYLSIASMWCPSRCAGLQAQAAGARRSMVSGSLGIPENEMRDVESGMPMCCQAGAQGWAKNAPRQNNRFVLGS